jgi:hypothetical protein
MCVFLDYLNEFLNGLIAVFDEMAKPCENYSGMDGRVQVEIYFWWLMNLCSVCGYTHRIHPF